MIYEPHVGLIFKAPDWTQSDTIPCHLTGKQATASMLDTGQNQTQTATLIFRWEDRGKLSMGDRILVDGEMWIAITDVVSRNEIYILREARVNLEKVEVY